MQLMEQRRPHGVAHGAARATWCSSWSSAGHMVQLMEQRRPHGVAHGAARATWCSSWSGSAYNEELRLHAAWLSDGGG